MERRLCLVAFAAGALASIAPQAYCQPAEAQQRQGNATAPVSSNEAVSKAPEKKEEGCPGTQYPRMKCEAISAQSDLEQARQSLRQANQSARQGDLFRTEILISFLTMIAAISAAVFAARAASAARETVVAFTAVESADLVVTLEDFGERGGFLTFKAIANNLGRSTALVVHAACTWHESMDDSALAFAAAPKTYIIKAGESVPLDIRTRCKTSELQKASFLWLLIMYNSPLRGFRTIRYCFQIWGMNSEPSYMERYRRESDRPRAKRPWGPLWRKASSF